MARQLRAGVRTAVSPNDRLQQLWHPWTSYVIVPLFGLANAGIPIDVGFLAKAQGSTFQVTFAEAEWKFESGLVAAHHLPGAGAGVQTAAEWTPEAEAEVTSEGGSEEADTDA